MSNKNDFQNKNDMFLAKSKHYPKAEKTLKTGSDASREIKVSLKDKKGRLSGSHAKPAAVKPKKLNFNVKTANKKKPEKGTPSESRVVSDDEIRAVAPPEKTFDSEAAAVQPVLAVEKEPVKKAEAQTDSFGKNVLEEKRVKESDGESFADKVLEDEAETENELLSEEDALSIADDRIFKDDDAEISSSSEKSGDAQDPSDGKKKKSKKEKKHRFKKWFNGLKTFAKIYIIVLLAAILCFVGWGIKRGFNQTNIDTTFYQVKSDKVNNNIRAVVLSDLHQKEFGKDNVRLVNKIRNLKPDVIFIVGDMVNYSSKDYSVDLKLCRQLVKLCDVYYSYGNHETSLFLFKDYGKDFIKDLKATGVTVLDKRCVDVTVGNTTISVGAICGGENQLKKSSYDFLEKFTDTDEFTLLLCHQPEVFLSGKLDSYPIDLALCGHTHGGEVILPYFGGLYSKNQGFFPEYDYGKFEREKSGTNIIISRGLGTSSALKRFNNDPEIVVVDIDWY